MSKWKNVSIPGVHDWDNDLKALLTADPDGVNAPLEVDWTNPDAIAAAREMVVDAMLPALADALQGMGDQFADLPPVGRPAIIGGIADAVGALESFMGPVIVSQTKPGERRVRAALGLSEDGYRGLAEQAGMVARTVTEARGCGCGNLHPCGLADGSMLFAGVEQGKPPEFRLAPWWQGQGQGEAE